MARNELYSDSESGSESDSATTANAFAVNKDFAKRYDEKKRTEELSKLQDKYGKDYQLDDDEDSEEDLSDDDEDAELVTPQVDAAILRTLAKIRNKDPSVYEEGREVFDEEEQRTASSSKSTTKKASTSKPVLLKDYQRSRLLADPTGSAPDGDEVPLTFAQESQALKEETKRAFHAADDEDEDDGMDGLLVPRSKTKDEKQKEEEDYQQFLKKNVGEKDVEAALEHDEKFLRDYILNRGWLDRADKSIPSYKDITGDDEPAAKKSKKSKKTASAATPEDIESGGAHDPSAHDEDDEEFEEQAEEFENKYNFRFEEEAGAAIQTHSRQLTATTARKPTAAVSARARARDVAKERKEEEKRLRKEEVRRLKALKRKEVEEKLLKIIEAGGKGVTRLEEVNLDLDGEWDAEEHDRKMKQVYGEEYDGAEDDDFKPEWDDDIDITDIQGLEDAEDVEADEMQVDEEDESSKKKKKKEKGKRKRDEEGFPEELLEAAKAGGDEARKQLLESLMDDYYGLDYEDKIGDLPTRFKYAKVERSSFDLSPAEILMATDAELNSYMSLRKIAPYRQSSSSEEHADKKRRKKLKGLKDALKSRTWGVDLDEDEGAQKHARRAKYIEEGRKKKREEAKEKQKEGGANVAAVPKRKGKKERQRQKAAAQAGGSGNA
ncbi:Krr1-domain-containing protein [Meredithblackwellia eburnea MCA 4105]